MDNALARIVAQTSLYDTISACDEELHRLGVVSASFHVGQPQSSQIGPGVYIASFGQPEDWRKAYLDPEYRKHDPIPDFVMRYGSSISFSDALAQIKLTKEQAHFVDQLKATPLIDSLAVPAYGPFDFDSYGSFCLGRPLRPEDDQLHLHIVMLTEVTNRRCAQLFHANSEQDIAFSPREAEVLGWLSRSKSNADIAAILGVSQGTVDTFIRRIFAKLEVNDRISATLKAVRLGYVRF